MINKILPILVLFMTTPAHADLWNESAESYYARQMKSCEYKLPRESVWDLFAATRPVYLDECCADSVRAMQKANGKRIAGEGSCAEGQVKTSKPCASSKHWCQ